MRLVGNAQLTVGKECPSGHGSVQTEAAFEVLLPHRYPDPKFRPNLLVLEASKVLRNGDTSQGNSHPTIPSVSRPEQ